MVISVITVVYNNKNTIERCIRSVLNQKYKDIEFIIIDGSSTDGTIDIIKSYGNKISKFVSESDNGIYDAMNKGIKLVTGDVIGFLNSDDRFYENDIVSRIAYEFCNSEIDCCYANLLIKDEDNNIVRNWISSDFKKGLFQKSWTPAHPTFYCKKEVYEKFGSYRTDYQIASDTDLMFRFLDIHKIRSKFIDQYFVIMSHGGVSGSGIKSTITITKEVRNSIIERKQSFSIIVYLIYKIIKMIKQKT